MTLENLINTGINVGQYITQLNQQAGAQDAANLVKSGDAQVQDAPGAPVGSGLANYWAQNYSSPLPPTLQGMIGNQQALANQKTAQAYKSGLIDQPTALFKIAQDMGANPSGIITTSAFNRAQGLEKTPDPNAPQNSASNPVAQANPNLASMGGVQSAPITPMNGGDNTPSLPAPANVSGSMQYPGLAASQSLLNGSQQSAPAQNPLLPAVAQVESGNNPNALSNKGAAGKFQIEPTTAANPGYGVKPLQGWDGKDPRTAPPEEQARFANDYLNAMQQSFGVPIGTAAYNAGPGRVGGAVEQAGGNPNKVMPLLPQETQNYVPKVMAAAGAPNLQSTPIAPFAGGITPQGMAALNYGTAGSPMEMMKTGSELQKNQAETQMDTAKANEAAEAANTARWTRGETGSPPSPQAAGTSQPVMASDNKPLLPSLAKGVQFPPDPQRMPDFMPALPQGATKVQQDNAAAIAKTQYESASKQYEGFGTLQQSLSNEKYYTERMAQIYHTMASPNAVAEYPEMAKTLFNLGFPVDASKGLDGVQEALNTGMSAVIQNIKDASVGLDANHPMRVFGTEVSAKLENAIAPGLTPTARFNAIATALGLTNRNLEAIQSYNSPEVGGLGNRLDGGKTMPPTEYVQQFMASHDPMDYRQKVVDTMPPFKGMQASPNDQHIAFLKQNANNPAMVSQFEQKFGAGSAKQYLGGQ